MLLVTLGICCFNARDTIERAIASGLSQDWPSLEVVVADDASSDGSAEIVERLASEDSRIRLVRRPVNGGVAATRNTIIAYSRGAYIAFLDDDDESAPDRIRRQVESLQEAEALTACLVSRQVIGADIKPFYSRAAAVANREGGEQLALNLLCGDPLASPGRTGAGTMMASAATFEAVGPFDEGFRRAEETDWFVRLALIGGGVIGCAEPLLTQYLTEGPDKGWPELAKATRRLRRKHAAFLRSHRAYIAAALHAERLRAYRMGRRNISRLMVAGLMLVRPRVAAPIVRRKLRRMLAPA